MLSSEEIFKEEYDPTRVERFADYQPISSDTNKSYIRKIYSLNIPIEVKIEIEKKISSVDRRFHNVSDEVLCVLTITSFQEKGFPYDFDNIIGLFGLIENKTKVLELLSKATTKSTILNEINSSISMVVIKPSKYIVELLNIYITKYHFNVPNIEDLQNRVKGYCMMLEQYYPPLQQYSPKDTACAVLYSYFDLRMYEKKRTFFSKHIFLTLLAEINNKKFSTSYSIICLKLNEINILSPGYLSQF